jgi:putative membrane protein
MPSEPPPVPPPAAPPEGPASHRLPEVQRFATPQRLHPASVVLGVNLRQFVQALLFPILAGLAAGGIFTLGFLLVAAVVGLAVRVLAWQRFTFAFDGEVVRVEEGVLSRHHRALDVARIQQVELDRSALQRLLGLAALRIETAGSSSEVEVELRVLPDADAVALREAVRASRAAVLAAGTPDAATGAPIPTEPAAEIIRVPLGHVVLAAVTGAQLLVFPALLAASFQFLGDLTTAYLERALDQLIETGLVAPDTLTVGPGWQTVTLFAIATIVLSFLTAVIVGVLREANFTVIRVEDDLHLTRGLLSTRDSVVPLRRVQLVEVQRNWARRLLGFASIRIHSAGGSGDASRRVAVPLVADGGVDGLLQALLPGVPGVPPLTPHPPTALRRAILRWVRPALFLPAAVWLAWAVLPAELAAAVAWLEPARWYVLALPVAAALLGAIEYRQLAHGLTDRVIAARQGALSVTTAVAPVVKVQAASSRRSYFQRRLGLATVTAHVAGPGGDVQVLDAGHDAATALQRELTAHAASPAVPVLTSRPLDRIPGRTEQDLDRS